MQALLSTLFIVWRESIEALLVIGILYAWLEKNHLKAQLIRLWAGSGLGLALACCLAAAFFLAGEWFSGAGGEWFFSCMMAVASLLIMQMIVWMHRHGRSMKQALEREAAESVSGAGGFGIAVIAMIAVAREGSETVIFLAGVGSQNQGASLGLFVAGGIAGFALALISFYILQKLANAVSWKWYFRVSEFVLLLIGGAMMVSAADKISGQISGYDLPDWAFAFMGDPLWNTQGIIPDNSMLTSMLASLTGYRAQPSLMEVLALILYWAAAVWLCSRSGGAGRKQAEKLKTAADTDKTGAGLTKA